MSAFEHFHLLSRGLFSSSDAPSNHSCPWEPSLEQVAPDPIFGSTTFHQFNVYFSGGCAILSTLIAFALIFMHGTHFSRPREQRKIIKLISLVPSYSFICWLSIRFPDSMPYLEPWLELLQAICLATFFLLLNEFVSDGVSEREMFFAALDIPSKKARNGDMTHYDTAESKLSWYRKKWLLIFQYPVVALLVAIASDITQAVGVYCEFSSSPHYAHLWLQIIINVSVALAVIAIINLYKATKMQLAHHKPLMKLICFKIIVGLGFLISIIFLILNGVNALKPTATLSYGDLRQIPNMILIVFMVPISIFFHIAYPWSEYRRGAGHNPIAPSSQTVPIANREYQGGFLGWKAYIVAASPMEVLRGIAFTFKMASEHRDIGSQNAQASTGLLPSYHQKPEQQQYRQQQYGYAPQSYPQQPYPPRSARTPSPYRGSSPHSSAGDYNVGSRPQPRAYDPVRQHSP